MTNRNKQIAIMFFFFLFGIFGWMGISSMNWGAQKRDREED